MDFKFYVYKLILGSINLINFVAKPFLSILKNRPILSGFFIGISVAAVAVKLLYFGAETWPNAVGSIIEHLVRSIDRYFLIEPEPPKIEQHTKLSDFTKKSLIWAFAAAVIGLGTINTVTLIFGFSVFNCDPSANEHSCQSKGS